MPENSSTDYYSDDSELELKILNPDNSFITKSYINGVLKKYNVKHRVKDMSNFIISTVHSSYLTIDNSSISIKMRQFMFLRDKELEPLGEDESKKCIPLQKESYERIEFLGDSIIRAILSDYFYERYKEESEGFLTNLRTKVECADSLAHLCQLIGLNRYIIISRYNEQKEGRSKSKKIHEDVFEGFIGALHLDGGYEVCKTFLVNLIETEVDIPALLHFEDNYKDILLKVFHKRQLGEPQYKLVTEMKTDFKSEYTMSVIDSKHTSLGVGTSSSKKKAEQMAAYKALVKLDYYDDESESEYEELTDSESATESEEYVSDE